MKRILILSLAVAVSLASPVSDVFEIDISPEEAQRYLANPPFSEPQLSGRTAVLPLVRWNDPRFRSAESGPTNGHYWKNGKEIENVDDYVEEVYDASQFHGQDGLGQYAYGYSAPESAKVENREHSGDVKGSYTYRDGNDQLIQVRYWADSEGFHQEDNLPKVVLEPAQETQEVREARLAHEKAWQEAAAAAAANPDPQGDYDAKKYEYETSASEQQNSIADQGEGRQGKAYQVQAQAQYKQQAQPSPAQAGQFSQVQASSQAQYRAPSQPQPGQYSQTQSSQFSSQAQYKGQASGPAVSQSQGKYNSQQEEVEPTGPPRGFFYSFTYPVSILVAKNAQGQQHGAGGPPPGAAVDHDTVGVSASSTASHYG